MAGPFEFIEIRSNASAADDALLPTLHQDSVHRRPVSIQGHEEVLRPAHADGLPDIPRPEGSQSLVPMGVGVCVYISVPLFRFRANGPLVPEFEAYSPGTTFSSCPEFRYSLGIKGLTRGGSSHANRLSFFPCPVRLRRPRG